MRTLVESTAPSSATTFPTMSSVMPATTCLPSAFSRWARCVAPSRPCSSEECSTKITVAASPFGYRFEITRASSTTAEVPDPSSSAPGATLVESTPPLGGTLHTHES